MHAIAVIHLNLNPPSKNPTSATVSGTKILSKLPYFLLNLTAKYCMHVKILVYLGNFLLTVCYLVICAAKPPKITTQPTSQNDVLQGSPLSFKIKATGAEPLSYQWQWKPAGKEDEQHEWQDVSGDSTTFQEVEGGLKLAGVQACHAGNYRCVVSNSAGSEISQGANLTVGKITVVLQHFCY